MWLLWSNIAFAAPPTGVDPEDLDRWESFAAAALKGPDGCWEIDGRIDLVMAAYTPATMWTRAERSDHRFTGSFAGKLDAGVWTKLDYDLSNALHPSEPAKIDVPIFPTVGKISPNTARRINPSAEGSDASVSGNSFSIGMGKPKPKSDTAKPDASPESDGGISDEAIHLFTEMLEEIDPASATAYGEWDEEEQAVKLIQDIPISDKPSADTISVVTRFPGGGAATSVDATFPTRIRVGEGLIKATIFDGQLHLRGQQVGNTVLPALESLSFGFGAMGFTVGYEQKLSYTRATPCESGS